MSTERPAPKKRGTQESSRKNGRRREDVRGNIALKKGGRGLDVVRPNSSLIPEIWKRKTGRAGSLIESFYHAFHGLKVAFVEQRNLRIHCFLSCLVVAAGLFFHIDVVSWIALTMVMAMVIAAELFNTALEHLVDISSDGQYSYPARLAKDTAASAVLAMSVMAVIVGAMIFVPKIAGLFIH